MHPGDDVEQRGLAGAVRTDETGDAAAVDGEGNAIDGANAAKVHVEINNRDHGNSPRTPGLGTRSFPMERTTSD